jgi:hypothetical protein
MHPQFISKLQSAEKTGMINDGAPSPSPFCNRVHNRTKEETDDRQVPTESSAVPGFGWWCDFSGVVDRLRAFLAFTEVYIMTAEAGGGVRGGPNYATNLMAFHIFNTAIAYGTRVMAVRWPPSIL